MRRAFMSKPMAILILMAVLILGLTACEGGPMGPSKGGSSGGGQSVTFSGKRLEAIRGFGSNPVYLMSGPSSGSGKVATLAPGTTVEVKKMEGDWIYLTTQDGKDGWVHGGYVTGFAISRPD